VETVLLALEEEPWVETVLLALEEEPWVVVCSLGVAEGLDHRCYEEISRSRYSNSPLPTTLLVSRRLALEDLQ
jgi:hypothetical protein